MAAPRGLAGSRVAHDFPGRDRRAGSHPGHGRHLRNSREPHHHLVTPACGTFSGDQRAEATRPRPGRAGKRLRPLRRLILVVGRAPRPPERRPSRSTGRRAVEGPSNSRPCAFGRSRKQQDVDEFNGVPVASQQELILLLRRGGSLKNMSKPPAAPVALSPLSITRMLWMWKIPNVGTWLQLSAATLVYVRRLPRIYLRIP